MSISYIKQAIVFTTLCFYFNVFGQQNLVVFHEPQIALNHKFSNTYKANFSIAGRHFMYRDKDVFLKNRQLQVVHFSTLSLSYNKSFSIGIMYRNRDWFKDTSNELRFTQQFNYTKRKSIIRFGHRFRNEQRVFSNNTSFRLRYRLALDSPLQGEKLDVGETYLVVNTEFLLSLNKDEKPQLDNRITSLIGYQTSEDLKLQLGLQYRFEDFNNTTDNVLLLLTSAIFKL